MLRSLLACAVIATAATAQVSYYSAYLDAAQEVPPNASTAHGWGIARFDAGTNGVQLYFHHTTLSSTATAAHMHQGVAGANGGVIIGMTQVAPGTWSGSGTLNAAQATALTTGGMYFNVHTTTNPGGELRGQIVTSASTRFTANLVGSEEVPPTGSAATGTAVAFLHEPDNRLVYNVSSSGLANVTAAHFHQGAFGANGGVVVGFSGNGNYCGVSQRLTAAQVAALKADGFYANIHTAAFPGGEIRGQMRKDVGNHFYAICNGAAETPPVASTAQGAAQLIVNPNGTVTVTGAYTGIASGAVAAHVHLGAVGVAGGVVFPISFAGGVLSGTFTPSATDLTNLRAGNWYVNIHSSAFPGGEIRGQLTPATLPATYGEGCQSTSGFIPHVGTTNFASMGSPMSFDLYGVPAGSFSIMFVGDNRDPGPVELPAIGIAAPGCYALMSTILLQFTVGANALGCASLPVVVPFDPNLRNIPLHVQFATLDLGANAANVAMSNATTFFVH